jgi:hypothetical protein
MERVSRKYLLLSVPYRQRVWNEYFKCRACGHLENNMGHRHSFDESSLALLFPAMRCINTELVARVRGYAPDWLYRLARVHGDVWFDYWLGRCPACGSKDSKEDPNWRGEILVRFLWRLEHWARSRPAWLLMLLSKE